MPLSRTEHYGGAATVDGLPVYDSSRVRLKRLWQEVTTSDRERVEADLDRLLGRRRQVTRTNLVAVVSPKGGVGKTTCSFVTGDALTLFARLRVLVIDTNPDFGTLGMLSPDAHSSGRQLTDVIERMDRIRSTAELDPFMSTTPAGLHLLAAPQHPEVMEQMSPELYGRLLAFLGRFYHVIILDLGTGLTDPLARFALERADQAIVVNKTDWITAATVLKSLDYIMPRLHGHQITMAVNMANPRADRQLRAIEKRLSDCGIRWRVTIPNDPQLEAMLNQGNYACAQLDRGTRMAVKHLAQAVAAQLH